MTEKIQGEIRKGTFIEYAVFMGILLLGIIIGGIIGSITTYIFIPVKIETKTVYLWNGSYDCIEICERPATWYQENYTRFTECKIVCTPKTSPILSWDDPRLGKEELSQKD